MNLVQKEYHIFGKKGEGTFSEVLKCQHIKTGKYYACKKMKHTYESGDQVNNLREIQAMRRLHPHPNVIALHEVIFDKRDGSLALILELMDMNIYELIKGRKNYLPETKVKHYMWQLCKAIDHMHRHGIFHRDVKPENILILDDVLKLADFGSCRSIFSKQPYTEYISTRWYRAPECLLTDGYYGAPMDVWSVGCVMYEIITLQPLFPGSNEVDQISKIHTILGTPSPDILQRFKGKARTMQINFPPKRGTGLERRLTSASSEAVDFIRKMCIYDPEVRLTSKQLLKHVYFQEFRETESQSQQATISISHAVVPSVVAVNSVQNKENLTMPSENRPVAVNMVKDTSSKANVSPAIKKNAGPDPPVDTLRSIAQLDVFQTAERQAAAKERERRYKQRKAMQYYGLNNNGNITFPSLVPKLNGHSPFPTYPPIKSNIAANDNNGANLHFPSIFRPSQYQNKAKRVKNYHPGQVPPFMEKTNNLFK